MLSGVQDTEYFIDPTTIIKHLSKKIRKKNIILNLDTDHDSINYRPSGGPIQPLSDIMLSALIKYDYGTLKEGIKGH